MIKNTTNLYENLEKKISDLVIQFFYFLGFLWDKILQVESKKEITNILLNQLFFQFIKNIISIFNRKIGFRGLNYNKE